MADQSDDAKVLPFIRSNSPKSDGAEVSAEPSIDDVFERIADQNREKIEKIKAERKRANSSVLRTYRLKQ